MYLNETGGREKSFYNKCRVEVDDRGVLICYSYDTAVAWFDPVSKRLWFNGIFYSITTHRHRVGFCTYVSRVYGIDIDYSGTRNDFLERYSK